MYDNALETYFDQYMTLSDNKKRKLDNKYDLVNLFPLLICLFKHRIMISGLKMKNRLIQQGKVIKKNRLIQQEKVVKKSL